MTMKPFEPNDAAVQLTATLRKYAMAALQQVLQSMKAEDAVAVSQQIDAGASDVAIDILIFSGEAQLTLVNPSGENVVLAEFPLPALTKVDEHESGGLQ